MSTVVFFFCGAHVAEETWWEQQWASSLLSSGLAHEVRIRAAPLDGAYGSKMPHWWCQYHEEPWEQWKDATVCTTFDDDIAKTGLGICFEIAEVLAAGHSVAFVGSSNGGHVALHMSTIFSTRFLILCSSVPLKHQEISLLDSGIPTVMTVGSEESNFGGASAMRTIARRVGAWRVDFEGRHCKETCATMWDAMSATKQWLCI